MSIIPMSKTDPVTVDPLTAKVTEPFQIERLANGQLAVRRNGAVTAVNIRLCFPWSSPGRHISLRDEKNNELALIGSVADLDPAASETIEESLAEAGFLFEIRRIESIDCEYEIRNWKVTTRQGACTFQTELDDWPRELPDGGLLIKDVTGNLFHIPDPKALDAKSRKLIWAFAG